MCGINWFVWKNLDNSILKNMNQSINHRWPDDSGLYFDQDKNIALWQVRLSIIDLSDAGAQPMFYDKKSWASSHLFQKKNIDTSYLNIVFNWEIYNYQKIRSNLKKRWYIFSTNTDTEVVLASYCERWESCVNKFNGMRSFVIYDKKNNKLFCSRDRLWKKPFYYYYNDNKFIFSSEIKWILEHKNLNINTKNNINQDALEFYFTIWFIPAPYSIYKNIFKLEARNNLIFDLNTFKIKTKKYYEIPEYSPVNNKKYLIDEWKKILKDSVKIRMFNSDVPVWAFLSWWLDSSAIVWEMRKHVTPKNLHTFSVWFEWKYDETSYIDVVKNCFWTNHHHEYFKESDFEEMFNDISYHYDEPFGDFSSFPSMFVSEFAKKDVTVALSWDWWDEIFWWYYMHQLANQINVLYKIPVFIRKIVYKLIPLVKDKFSLFWKIKEGIKLSLLPKHKFYGELVTKIPWKWKKFIQWADAKFKILLEKNDWNIVQSMIDFDLFYYTIPDNFLVKVDRASMSHSLEVRSPLLDYRFIEYSRKIPTKWKCTRKRTKIIMRDIVKDIVPKLIINRNKQWFTPPIVEWVNNKDNLAILNRWINKLSEDGIIDSHRYKYFISHINKNNIHSNNIKTKFLLFIIWYSKWVRKIL